jgi:hypothetical protein
MLEKRGQVTIFIIIGILIVTIIALFFIARSGVIPSLGQKTETNSNTFLTTCIESRVKDGINKLLSDGGSIQSTLNLNFGGTDIAYLCYTQNNYEPCANQQPALLNHLESEMKNYISDEIDTCFKQLQTNFEKQGNTVALDYNKGDFNVNILPGEILIHANSKLTLTKSGESTTQNNFDLTLPTKLYELSNVVKEAVEKEMTTCNFDYRAYQLLYPQFQINQSIMKDSSKVYQIESKDYTEIFTFATRGCVTPII